MFWPNMTLQPTAILAAAELIRYYGATRSRLAAKFNIYAYDACFLGCAVSLKYPIITLDHGMQTIARNMGILVDERLKGGPRRKRMSSPAGIRPAREKS